MAAYRLHGGCCCGINHLVNFFEFTVDDERRADDKMENAHEDGVMVEVVLIDSEINLDNDWKSSEDTERLINWLAKWNFYLVTRFHNGNSNNYCNVFHSADRRERRAGVASLLLSRDGKVRGIQE